MRQVYFGDVSHVRENLTKVLDVDNGENDILFYQKISGIYLPLDLAEATIREEPGLMNGEIIVWESWKERLPENTMPDLSVSEPENNTGRKK